MSHFTTIKTQIKDIEALRCALGESGLALIPDAEARGYCLGSAINGLFQSILKRQKGWGSAPNPEVF